ncbi:MAG: threonine synthase [Mariprofundaceae bacterium]
MVSRGFMRTERGLSLHPELLLWQKQLSKRRKRWFLCENKVPLSWLAALMDIEPALLLAHQVKHQDEEVRQYWVASPYHAQLGRDHFRVLPDGLFPWSDEDANWLCNLLNPLLEQDAMVLKAVGAALLLLCRDSLDCHPKAFAEVSGSLLPNKHPEGADHDRLVRLLSEIQMLLYQNPSEHRRRKGEPDIHGLWLWGAAKPRTWAAMDFPAIATRNSFLDAVTDGKDASVTITDVEQFSELFKVEMTLPKDVILAGEGHAIWLSRSMLPSLRRDMSQPAKNSKSEDQLFVEINRSRL